MQEYNYVNPLINNIENQEISIQINLDGFSFLVRSSDNNQCLLFKHYEFKNIMLIDELIRKTESIVSKDPVFTNNYTKANLTFVNQKSTLVPEDFFNTEHLKTYFEFSHNLDELDELHYNYISFLKAYNVFSIPNYLTGIFYNLIPNITFLHQSTALIRHGMSDTPSDKPKVIIGINKGFFDIVVFEEDQLILSNSFQYSNTMDFIYFVLYTCKQLKIDTNNLNVYLLGQVKQNKNLVNELKMHIGSIDSPQMEIPGLCRNMDNLDAVRFYNLYLNKEN